MKVTSMNISKLIISITLLTIIADISFSPVSHAEDNTGHISGSIFEKHGGYFHGFLSIAEKYSDNILYENTNKKTDLITIVSPGIWISIPGSKDRLPQTDTASLTPGGIVTSSLDTGESRRLQASIVYSPVFEIYKDNSDEDSSQHLIEGRFQYRFSGGLTFGAKNQFNSAHDNRGSGFSQTLNEYSTNLTHMFASYDLTEKLTLKANLSTYSVDYTDNRNDDWDRKDNRISGSVYYHLTDKTSFFSEYEFISVGYDKKKMYDSDETSIIGGLQWHATDKSTGLFKFGWFDKRFQQSRSEDETSYRLEFQLNHWFTSKTLITIRAYRRATETNYFSTAYVVSDYAAIGYKQQLRSNLQLIIDGSYLTDDYQTKNMTDFQETYYRGSLGISYAFRLWFSAGCEYIYGHRNSEYGDDYGYTTSEILFRITASL